MVSAFGTQLEVHHRALVSEIANVEAHIAERTQYLRQLQLKLESVLELMKIEGVAPPQAHRHFLEVAHDVLLQSGAEHYVALASTLRAQGVLIPGSKPEANLLAHMSRDGRFKKVGRGTYEVSRHAKKANGGAGSATTKQAGATRRVKRS